MHRAALRPLAIVALAASGLLALGPAPVRAEDPAVDIRASIPYESPDGPRLTLDAYVPREGGDRRPAIVFVHGGGWEMGNPQTIGNLALPFARLGWPSFAVSYRLDTFPHYPDQVADVKAGVRWVRDHAAEYGVDPERIALVGVSAGGHVAALAAVRGEGPSGRGARVTAAVSWSGILDLARLSPRAGKAIPGCNASCRETWGTGAVQERVVGCRLDDCPDRYDEASPVGHVDASDPPMLLTASKDDFVPPSQALSLAATLDEHGVEHEVDVAAGDSHQPTDAQVLATANFLARQFGEPEPFGDDPARWPVTGAVLVAVVAAVVVARARARGAGV